MGGSSEVQFLHGLSVGWSPLMPGVHSCLIPVSLPVNDDLSCSRPSVSGRKEPLEKLPSVGGTKACLTANCKVYSWPLGRVSDC